ncbi:MAG: hypothetical protein LUI85_02465 [Bacteroides sp.]|nr:hypothetical protein [Bacteroides sp.]
MNVKIVDLRDLNSKDERILLKVLKDCNIGEYILFDTTYDGDGNPSNIFRHCYIFPSKKVNAGDYIQLYTGHGNQKSVERTDGYINHKFYWGSDEPIWNNEKDIAYLIHYDDCNKKEF